MFTLRPLCGCPRQPRLYCPTWKELRCPPAGTETRNVVSPYNGLVFSYKKKLNADTCYSTSDLATLWRVRRPDPKRQAHTTWFCLPCPEPPTLQRQEVGWGLPGAGGGDDCQWALSSLLFRVMMVFQNEIVIVVGSYCESPENDKIEQFKRMNSDGTWIIYQ